MIRRKTIHRYLLAGALCVLAVLIILMLRHVTTRFVDKEQQNTGTAASQTQSDTAQQQSSVSSALARDPFYLKITTNRFGEKTYQSFEVYFVNGESGDAIFSCGRKFASDEVLSIGWADEGYDVVVRLRNGSKVVYPYDGISTWQQ